VANKNQNYQELASLILERDPSLVKVRNKKLETPLHYAAKAGKEHVISCLTKDYRDFAKQAVRERNQNGDTALHLAVRNGHEGVVHELMKFDSKLAYLSNKEELSPFYIAISEEHTSLVKAMLESDSTLACTQDSDGMFPVHAVACTGNTFLLEHFIDKYPDDAEMLDQHGKNFFHIAAEENKPEVFTNFFESNANGTIANMINARDYEGNTPLHIAAMKGHISVMQAITQNETIVIRSKSNNKDLTPFDLSLHQVSKNASKV
jgi:ankyrin repeat protein